MKMEPAPSHNLPTWEQCREVIERYEFHQRAIAGEEGPYMTTVDPPPREPTALERFIYEYDDASDYRSAWFLHRLEQVLNSASTPQPDAAQPAVAEGVERKARTQRAVDNLVHAFLEQDEDDGPTPQPDTAQGDGMLPEVLVPHAKEWYRLCERRFYAERITISGELAEAIVEAISQPSASSSAAAGDIDALWRSIAGCVVTEARPHVRAAIEAAIAQSKPSAAAGAQGEDASCPFCGSKARRDDGYGGYISCSNITDDSGGCFMALDWFDASKWNRRAALTTHAPVVELPWPTISNAQLLKYTETRKGRLDGTLAQALLDTRAALARTQENG